MLTEYLGLQDLRLPSTKHFSLSPKLMETKSHTCLFSASSRGQFCYESFRTELRNVDGISSYSRS